MLSGERVMGAASNGVQDLGSGPSFTVAGPSANYAHTRAEKATAIFTKLLVQEIKSFFFLFLFSFRYFGSAWF